MQSVPNAKLVGGVWLPATEQHLIEMLQKNTKNHRVVEGKLTYQYRKLEAAMRRIPPERRRVALDVGAHVGLWAMWLVKEFSFVHCFEPVAAHADILPHNMPSQNYALHRVALGDVAGTVRMVVPGAVTGAAHIAPGDGDIPVRTLDSFELSEPVDFIKIDVEGFESRVVRGAEQTLLRHRPFMVLEQKGNDVRVWREKRDEALSWCRSIGMRPEYEIGGDWFLSWGEN